MSKILETKVLAATAGGGIGGALATFLLWGLGVLIWHAPSAAGSADLATAAVPAPVAGLLLTILPAALALLGGYLAPHTSRPDLASLSVPASDVVALVSAAGHLVAGQASTLPTGAPVDLRAPVRTLTDPTAPSAPPAA